MAEQGACKSLFCHAHPCFDLSIHKTIWVHTDRTLDCMSVHTQAVFGYVSGTCTRADMVWSDEALWWQKWMCFLVSSLKLCMDQRLTQKAFARCKQNVTLNGPRRPQMFLSHTHTHTCLSKPCPKYDLTSHPRLEGFLCVRTHHSLSLSKVP